MKSFHELILSKRKTYYGASKKVYRQCDLDRILAIVHDYSYLAELHTRCRLVPANEEFRTKKGIPHFNGKLKEMQLKYPDISEFHPFKPIEK